VTASARDSAGMPAATGLRPAETRTATSISRSFSSEVRVVGSPLVALTSRPSASRLPPDVDRTNVGPDKDSDKRQLAGIEAYAKSAGLEIVDTFYDAAVSGADQ